MFYLKCNSRPNVACYSMFFYTQFKHIGFQTYMKRDQTRPVGDNSPFQQNNLNQASEISIIFDVTKHFFFFFLFHITSLAKRQCSLNDISLAMKKDVHNVTSDAIKILLLCLLVFSSPCHPVIYVGDNENLHDGFACDLPPIIKSHVCTKPTRHR